jgi:hypothetical protein
VGGSITLALVDHLATRLFRMRVGLEDRVAGALSERLMREMNEWSGKAARNTVSAMVT